MQVLSSPALSPPPGQSMPSSLAAIFDRRVSKPALDLPRTFSNTPVPILSDTGLPSVAVKKPADGRTSRRPTIAGFLPMPPISASPICTPTPSSSSRDLSIYSDSGEDDLGVFRSTESAPTLDHVCLRSVAAPPKWISTPPTPPPKLFKRSVTCVARRPPSPSVTPSASFSSSMEPHASSRIPKRCASAPSMSARARSSSESSISFGKRTKVEQGATDSILAASPLRVSFIPPRESSTVFFTHSKPFYNIVYQVSNESTDDATEFGEGNSSARRKVDISNPIPEKDEKWTKEKLKDDAKKFHALVELLSTEVSYLQDLRALVSVYLRFIPTLALKRSPSSFSALSRHNSSTHLNSASSFNAGNVFDIHGLQPLTPVSAKEREKSPSRHIFTNSEVEVLARNAEEILQLHEEFVEELRVAMSPLGIPVLSQGIAERIDAAVEQVRGIGNIGAAIALVATKFATEASRFTSYETFCAGHPEALDIIRRVNQLHAAEWDAFEQRCGSMVSELLDDSTSPVEPVAGDASTPSTSASASVSDAGHSGTANGEKRKRANSGASTDNQRTTRSRSSSFTVAKDPSSGTSRNRSRLTFMDFLIKPVQRICKYPLLLDQLKTGKTLLALSEQGLSDSTDIDVVIESAARAMRHVASAVDEARRRQDVAVKSALVVSRISFTTVPPSSLNQSSSSTSSVSPQALTPTFVTSLGNCHMAGSLDVIHHRSSKPPANMTNINVKYLGAFLYLGGYFVLVKVSKGKVYEPRYWFRLCDFQITDPDMYDAWLPCSFRVSCKGHEFELAAACQREKEAWLIAIRESLAYPVSGWINEPISSLQADGKSEQIPSALDGPFETVTPLPTIQSISELGADDGVDSAETLNDTTEASTRGSRKLEPLTIPEMPSRRSSSTSVKAMFTPMSANPDTVIIRRFLPSARAQVDNGLHDVISAVSLAARSQATGREEELFQAPHVTRIGTSTSQPSAIPRPVPRTSTNSGLSMAKSRLRKHESVRVPRRKSLVDVSEAPVLNIMTVAPRAKSLSAKKRPRTICITSNNLDGVGSSMFFIPDSARSSSPPSITRNSSTATTPCSALSSPIMEHSSLVNGHSRRDSEPQKSRSRPSSRMGSVCNFFLSRSSSPSLSSTPCSPSSSLQTERVLGKSPSGSIFMRWVKGSSSSHRRTLSAPEPPSNQASSASSEELAALPSLTFGDPLKLVRSPEQV